VTPYRELRCNRELSLHYYVEVGHVNPHTGKPFAPCGNLLAHAGPLGDAILVVQCYDRQCGRWNGRMDTGSYVLVDERERARRVTARRILEADPAYQRGRADAQRLYPERFTGTSQPTQTEVE
jgi:hypothetical protein